MAVADSSVCTCHETDEAFMARLDRRVAEIQALNQLKRNVRQRHDAYAAAGDVRVARELEWVLRALGAWDVEGDAVKVTTR